MHQSHLPPHLTPSSLLFLRQSSLEDEVLAVVNLSLTGTSPPLIKTAVVKPLLKESNLDPLILNKFRPVANLLF